MPSAAPSPRPESRPRPIPLEDKDGGKWLARVRKTLLAIAVHPVRSFEVCPEPINHGAVLRFLATLRLPLWLVLLATLGFVHMSNPEGMGVPNRAIYAFVEPPLARVVSVWIVLMIPVGLPLLYFMAGLVAHVGVALTGGASRSIGASMRACGYVLGLMLVVVGLVDIPLYLGQVPGQAYLGVLGVMAVLHWGLVGIALAKTHRIGMLRGFIASLLPTVVFVAVTLARALLELSVVPGLPVPGGPYALP